MEVIIIIGSLATIAGLLYLLLIGQRSLPEWYREYKGRRKKHESEETAEAGPTEDQSSIQPRRVPHEEYVEVLRGFWKLSEESYVDIVCSEIPQDERHYFANPQDRNYLRYSKFADLDSLIYLRTSIAQLMPKIVIRDFTPSEYLDTHTKGLIVIGGPPWNSKYREFQSQLPLHFVPRPLGEDDPLSIHLIEGCYFLPTWGTNGELIKDISVFTRIQVEKEVPVFLLAGCLTVGVLGASKCFLDRSIGPSNVEHIESIVGGGDFVAVFETYKVGGFVVTPDLNTRKPLVVLKQNTTTRKFEVVVENVDDYRAKTEKLNLN